MAILEQINEKNFPSCIQCWYWNSQPLEIESLTLTSRPVYLPCYGTFMGFKEDHNRKLYDSIVLIYGRIQVVTFYMGYMALAQLDCSATPSHFAVMYLNIFYLASISGIVLTVDAIVLMIPYKWEPRSFVISLLFQSCRKKYFHR